MSINYYQNKTDADTQTNLYYSDITYVISTTAAGWNGFRIASNSTGTSSQTKTYIVGDTLDPVNSYNVYPATITYYGNVSDALNRVNEIATQSFTDDSYPITDWTIQFTAGLHQWRIASNSLGDSSQTIIYPVGSQLSTTYLTNWATYFIYPVIPCFLEGTKILCRIDNAEKYLPIELLKNGTFVKTIRNGFKKVELIGKGDLQNYDDDDRVENRLYKCTPSNYPELTEDLFITGCHSILVDDITQKQREDLTKQMGQIFITDKKYRLTASVDERAEPWRSEGVYTIWHIALENPDIKKNYGIYANGLLVETCSINFLKNRSNMTLV